MPRYHTVLLDADNTLFDFNASEMLALNAVFTARGYTPDEETIAVYLEINSALWEAFARGEVEQDFLLEERFRRFVQVMGGDHDAAQFNLDYQKALAANGVLIPGALELCRRLAAAGCTLAIITNGAAIAQRGRYAASPLRQYIPHLFISQELGVGKPDPLFFDTVCRELDLTDRSGAVVVGDSLSADIVGGNRAGIDTIWYNPRRAPLTGPAQPTYTTENFDQVEQIILASPAKEQ